MMVAMFLPSIGGTALPDRIHHQIENMTSESRRVHLSPSTQPADVSAERGAKKAGTA